MLAALPLHNYIRLTSNAMYTPSGFVDSEGRAGSIHLGEWHNRDICSGFNNIRPIRGNRNRLEVVQIHDEIKEYLNSDEGSSPWQQDCIRSTYRNNNIWCIMYCLRLYGF